MALKLQSTFLGLGSIIRLDNTHDSGLFVVLARGAYRPDSEQNGVISRYLVGPHPFGEAPDHETFPVLASEVSEIVFEGYTDDADAVFLADLLDQMEHGRRPTKQAQQFTEALTDIADRPEEVPGGDTLPRSGDPFAKLRLLIDQNDGKSE